MRPTLKRLAANLLVLLLSMGLSVAGAEGAVRILGLFATAREALNTADVPEDGATDDGTTEDGGEDDDGETVSRMLIHPFLGWSRQPRKFKRGFGTVAHHYPDGKPPGWTADFFTVNSFGYHSPIDDYREVGPDRFVVGVFGGSVAAQLTRFAGDTLAEAIERRRPETAGRVTVLSFGVGGYKQPQQLISLVEMLALDIRFDAVVNLDGLNEAAFGTVNAKAGIHPLFPSINHYKTNVALSFGPRSEATILATAAVLRERQAAEQILRSDSVLRRSALVQAWLGWRLGVHQQRAIALEAAAQEIAVAEEQIPLANLSAPCLGTPNACRAVIASIWASSSRQMEALARQAGAEYAHFLQPNQHVPGSKPMGEAEREVAGVGRRGLPESVVSVYPLFQEYGQELVEEGIAFHDLTMLYADHPEPLYVDDCCHLNVNGYRMMAEAVAEGLVATR